MNTETENNKKPLFNAIKTGKFDIASQLIDNGSDVNMLDSDGNHALLLAVSVFLKGIPSNAQIMEQVKKQEHISQVGTEEALELAQSVSSFIEKKLGIDEDDDEHPTYQDETEEVIELDYTKCFELIQKIITAGAEVNLHNKKDDTALIMAMSYNNDGLIELLTKYGAR